MITALDPRLSYRDELQGKSYSISSQKRILEAYANYPCRPVDRRCPLESPEGNGICCRAWKQLCEAACPVERDRRQEKDRRSLQVAYGGRRYYHAGRASLTEEGPDIETRLCPICGGAFLHDGRSWCCFLNCAKDVLTICWMGTNCPKGPY